MYTRELKKAPEKIISKGKAQFGSFSDVSRKIDIKGMHSPYAGIPLPAFISNLRIKSRVFYTFNIENYIGYVEFFDFKAFGLVDVTLWDKKTKTKFAYHNMMTPRRRFVPTHTDKGACTCYRKKRFVRIGWKNNHQNFVVDFHLKGDKIRPDFNCHINSTEVTSNLMFVAPAPTSSRCTATWFSTMKIMAKLTKSDKTSAEDDNSEGLACQILSRAYYKFYTNQIWTIGIGKIRDKDVIFRLNQSNLDSADNDKNNHNALVVNGEETPLPPVVMTYPFGVSKTWVIQDTENMVDLTFTPLSVHSRVINIIMMRNDYTGIYGTFEGVLIDKNGEKITLKNFPGIIYKNHVRT